MKFLFILLFVSTTLFAQNESISNLNPINVSDSKDTPISTKKEKKKYEYKPHTIGITSRFNGALRVNVSCARLLYLSTTTLDFYVGENIGKTKYSSLIQFRLSAGTKTAYSSQYPFIEEFRWGLLLGGSQYIFDRRTENGIGWSMIVNGGMILDAPEITRAEKNVFSSILNTGIELNFQPIYNFSKYVAITFGFNIGYLVGYTYRTEPLYDHEGFPKPISTGLYIEHGLFWGLNIGILF